MDGAIVLVCRLILATCFAVAGVAKLREGGADADAMATLGAPRRIAAGLRWMLPGVELASAPLVLWTPTAVVGAGLMVVLLTGFTLVVAAAIARGRHLACGCFGSVSKRPLGVWTLVRNLALIALAVLVILVASPVLSPPAQGLAGALVIIAVQAWLLARPVPRVTVKASWQGFRLPTTASGVVDLGRTLRRERAAVLTFVDPLCAPCLRLLPSVARWQREAGLAIFVISRGDPAVNAALAEQYGLRPLLLQQDFELAQAFSVRGTPSAVHVTGDGAVVGAPVLGADAISALVKRLQPATAV